MSTCNRLDLKSLRSQPITPKNLPNQWSTSVPLGFGDIRASPPCCVKGSWLALWRGLGEKTCPTPLHKHGLDCQGSSNFPFHSLSLLRPHSGFFLASATCVKAYRKYCWHLFYMKSKEATNEREYRNKKKLIASLEPFKGLFESLPLCSMVEML